MSPLRVHLQLRKVALNEYGGAPGEANVLGLERTGDPGVWRLLCTVPAAPQRHTSSLPALSHSLHLLSHLSESLFLISFRNCKTEEGTGDMFLFAVCTGCHPAVSKTVTMVVQIIAMPLPHCLNSPILNECSCPQAAITCRSFGPTFPSRREACLWATNPFLHLGTC